MSASHEPAASAASEPVAPPAQPSRTRRAVLGGLVGGAVAWAASAIGRAAPVRAGTMTIRIGCSRPSPTPIARLLPG